MLITSWVSTSHASLSSEMRGLGHYPDRTGAASDDGQLRNARAQVAGGKRLRARVNWRRKTVQHNWRVSDVPSGAENERLRRRNNVVGEAKHMIPANVSSFVRAELSLTSSVAQSADSRRCDGKQREMSDAAAHRRTAGSSDTETCSLLNDWAVADEEPAPVALSLVKPSFLPLISPLS